MIWIQLYLSFLAIHQRPIWQLIAFFGRVTAMHRYKCAPCFRGCGHYHQKGCKDRGNRHGDCLFCLRWEGGNMTARYGAPLYNLRQKLLTS